MTQRQLAIRRFKDDLIMKIESQCQDGLAIKSFPEKGRGVIATKSFNKNDFVTPYVGDLISGDEIKKRELKYKNDPCKGSFMFYFKYNKTSYCIDATCYNHQAGRLINHNICGNLKTKIVEVEGKPHLVFFASRDIYKGDELTYDYADRSKENLKNFPWLSPSFKKSAVVKLEQLDEKVLQRLKGLLKYDQPS